MSDPTPDGGSPRRVVGFVDIVAWRVVGGPDLGLGVDEVVLSEASGHRIVLTLDPNPALIIADRGRALRAVLMAGGDDGRVLADAAWRQRERTDQGGVYLVVEARGSVDAELRDPIVERAGDWATFEVVDGTALRQAQRPLQRAARAAVVLDGPEPPQLEFAGGGYWLVGDDGRAIHDLRMRGGFGRMSVSRVLAGSERDTMRKRFETFRAHKALQGVGRNLSIMLESGDDSRRAFLAAWTALEQLIGKAAAVLQLPQTPRRCSNCKAELSSPPNLLDLFPAMVRRLLPEQTAGDHASDEASFRAIKNVRNDLIHGADVADDALPLYPLTRLLRKYAGAFADELGA